MPFASSYEDLYDFETAFEEGIAALLSAKGLNAVTRQNAATVSKTTPRVEVRFRNGEATRHAKTLPDGSQRWDAWRGTLSLQVVTDAPTEVPNGEPPPDDAIPVNQHTLIRAQVRNIAAQLPALLNGSNALPYYWVNEVLDAGTTPLLKSEDNFEHSSLVFSVHFNIRPDSWPQQQTT